MSEEGNTMVMTSPYDAWLKQLRAVAVEGFFISPAAAAVLQPTQRKNWHDYYQGGWGPLAALEEDLDGGPERMPTFDQDGPREEPE